MRYAVSCPYFMEKNIKKRVLTKWVSVSLIAIACLLTVFLPSESKAMRSDIPQPRIITNTNEAIKSLKSAKAIIESAEIYRELSTVKLRKGESNVSILSDSAEKINVNQAFVQGESQTDTASEESKNNEQIKSLTQVQLGTNNINLNVGSTYSLSVNIVGDCGTVYTAQINNGNANICCQSNDILITGIYEGTATLTVTANDGTKSVCRITVCGGVSFGNEISSSDIPSFQKWDTVSYITCRSAGLYRVPIVYDWQQEVIDNCDIAMGAWTNTMFGQGKGLFIGGHNYKSLRNLKNAEIGDTVLIETVYGANYLYKINYKDIILATHDDNRNFYGVADVNSGEYLQYAFEDTNNFGLITCADGYSSEYRWYVRAELLCGTKII